MDVEVPVFGLDGSALGDIEAFGECSRTVEVAIRVLVVGGNAVALPADARAVFAFLVAVDAEQGHRAESLLVGPCEIVFVQVEVCPVVTEGELQCVACLEDAVARGSHDCLHRDGVVV